MSQEASKFSIKKKEPAYIASSMTRTAGVVSVNEICFRQNKANDYAQLTESGNISDYFIVQKKSRAY